MSAIHPPLKSGGLLAAIVIKPPKRKNRISVAVPASTVSDVPHLREKTYKVGFIGRALAIFRVDEIIIYPDDYRKNQRKEMNFMATVLSYMETPQYLRKNLFKIRPELRYAGILPPLRTPHHPLGGNIEDLKIGEPREGVSMMIKKEGTYVDVGIKIPVLVPGRKIAPGKRITVQIKEVSLQPKASLLNKKRINVYWGYKVSVIRDPIGHFVKKRNFDLVIATSRLGDSIIDIMETLKKTWRSSRSILVAFGSPDRGLTEILSDEGLALKDFAQYTINTIPNQATETVRTEEALFATLSIFNLFDS